MKMTFQPKKRSRAKVHGFRARMATAGGRKVLAALVDPEKNLIGFPLSGSANQYVILSYDKDQGFQVQMQEEVNGNSYLGTRGVYANEKFYVINGNAIEAYRMGDYVKIDDLLL